MQDDDKYVLTGLEFDGYQLAGKLGEGELGVVYLAVNSPFPSDLEGVHIRLVSDFLLDLEEGDLFYIVCLNETFVYRIGTEGSNRCDLICAGLNYPGAHIVED